MVIVKSKISREFTDACNMDSLIGAIDEMIEKDLSNKEVKLSLNLNDPDRYCFEYEAEPHGVLSITRKGTSLTDKRDTIGSSGLRRIQYLEDKEEAVRDILGLTRVELCACDITGKERRITVSKGWHRIQDEDEDIFMKAFADVNASLVESDDPMLKEKIKSLSEMQRSIRECRTNYPEYPVMASLEDDFDTICISYGDGKKSLYEDDALALMVVQATSTGYLLAKKETKN